MSQSIFNGQSVTLPIQIGEKLTVVAVSGTYSIVVVDGVGDGTSLATSATGGTYGPYAYSSVVRVTSSALSEIDYDVGVTTSIVSDTVVKANTDGLTGRISLVAGGTDAGFVQTPMSNLFGILGDSRSASSFINVSNNVAFTHDWAPMANAKAGSPFKLAYMGGVSGDTLTQMLARVPAAVASGIGVCAVSNTSAVILPVAG